ncbi:MFS transporter [Teredinibacter waterburyi]|jgi:sugar (Glycoside-Pentoside-Hexuronide) transporter|uniref:MFS transporter n=1 Tax=Teredinibacter waterburyi TaxID=1500538 RepID=UPI00165EBF29|nr:glycoside-pentoside-hexuronide (GPH):cation symporter [Teredinibacter waterburyi]
MSNTATTAADRTAKLGIREKLGYGLGDFGFNLYWTTIASFLAAFYTDTFGISAAAAGTMMFTTKIIDACTDPIMGALADRTSTRWGKFRPYLLFAGLPMVGAVVLTFSTPDLNESGKVIYAYCTYTLMMMMYTVLSTPYSALSGVMTARSQERTSLISIRFIFAFSAGFFVNYFTLDFVNALGGGDDAKGWQLTMLIYGFAAAAIFFVTFSTTKERISPPASQKTNPLDDIRDLLGNRPWIILFILSMIIMMTITMRAGSAYYYFTYFLGRPDLLGAFLGVQMIAYAVGAACAPLMTRLLDKTRLLMVLMATVGTLSVLFTFVPKPELNGVRSVDAGQVTTLQAADLVNVTNQPAVYQWHEQRSAWWIFTEQVAIPNENGSEITINADADKVISVSATYKNTAGETVKINSGDLPSEIALMFLLCALISLALGPKSPITWSMYADTADFNEWNTGRRATAMTFSAATFAQKLGGATGSAGMLWVLAAFGYAAKEAQSDASQFGIVLLQTAVPGFFALLAVIVTKFYTLTGAQLEVIQADLKERQGQPAGQ